MLVDEKVVLWAEMSVVSMVEKLVGGLVEQWAGQGVDELVVM